MEKLAELKKELLTGTGCITYRMGCAFRGAILADNKITEIEELLDTCFAGKTALAVEYGKAVKYKEFFKKALRVITIEL